MALFKESINCWSDWGRVYQSIPAFCDLAQAILKKENLPLYNLEHLTPGTNAVFKVGEYVIKIFAPTESGIDQSSDLKTEIFSINRAKSLGVLTPKIIAVGFIEDSYRFDYIITEYIESKLFHDFSSDMSNCEKLLFGRKLREITDTLNTSCESFNSLDIILDKERNVRWNRYQDSFKEERLSYITGYDYGNRVFVHGDLCSDNILISQKGDIYIIDFADSVVAPICYEHGHIAVELFDFTRSYTKGFFGDCSVEELTDICFNGLLIHDFGADIIKEHVGDELGFHTLEELYKQIKGKIYASISNS